MEFREGKNVILATSSKKKIPNANIVGSLGFIDGSLLVADCQMFNTIKNLKENKNICVIGGYFRIGGRVKIYSSGKYFDICIRKSKGWSVKNALVISIDNVFNLDKGEVVL